MTIWGWKRTDKPSGIDWIPGDLAASYDRAAHFGGTWILVSAVPVSEFHRVMKETATNA